MDANDAHNSIAMQHHNNYWIIDTLNNNLRAQELRGYRLQLDNEALHATWTFNTIIIVDCMNIVRELNTSSYFIGCIQRHTERSLNTSNVDITYAHLRYL